MDLLRVTGIYKRQQGVPVVNGISFTQQRFQKIALAGETGSGKSTLLRMIAGLVQQDEGEVLLRNSRVTGPAERLIPGHPQIAYLSQQFELRNNYRVEEVLEYANRLRDEEAVRIFQLCRIGHLLARRTDQLSGGEKQRIALARLLIGSPSLLLLDEPFSNLDPFHKSILKSVIRNTGEQLQLTCMLVSHDPQDTLSWADEIMVIRDGTIIQQGTPQQVYSQPVNEYAAALFGKYNLLQPPASHAFTGLPHDHPVLLRPEQFLLAAQGSGAIEGHVSEVAFMGSYQDVEVIISGNVVVTVRTVQREFAKGERVFVRLKGLT